MSGESGTGNDLEQRCTTETRGDPGQSHVVRQTVARRWPTVDPRSKPADNDRSETTAAMQAPAKERSPSSDDAGTPTAAVRVGRCPSGSYQASR